VVNVRVRDNHRVNLRAGQTAALANCARAVLSSPEKVRSQPKLFSVVFEQIF
jgi:hypothetical protein